MPKKIERVRPVKVSGIVWCDITCGTHDDCPEPYGYKMECTPEDHRPVFVYAKPSEGEF